MRSAALVLAVLSASALAQSGQPALTAGRVVLQTEWATSADATYYVDSAGNDNNACTSTGVAACLTITGALSKVPQSVRHAVLVSVAAGNFAGFLYGKDVEATGSLLVRGTLSTATLATGSTSGTATSATLGSATIGSWGTLTLTGANWTASDLRAKFIRILTGPGAGEVHAISDNTDEIVTITGGWLTVPTNASTFDIVVPGTIINSNPTFPADLAGKGIAQTASTSNSIVIFGGSTAGASGILTENTRKAVQWLKTTSGPIYISNARRTGLYGMWIDSSSTGVNVNGGLADVVLSECVSTKTSQNFVSGLTAGAVAVVNAVVNGVATGLSISSSAKASISTSAYTNLTTAFVNEGPGGPTNCSVSSTVASGNGSSTGFKMNSSTAHTFGFWIVSSSSLTSFATAFEIRGAAFFQLTGISGSSNTTIISLSKSARMEVDSTTSITGTSEIVIDGAAATTFVALRAATPKVLPAAGTNAYGTAIWE